MKGVSAVTSQKLSNRKTISGVITAALVLMSLTACASSSQGGETTAREASGGTGRIKVCVKNETGSSFNIGYWDAYLDENNQPITARDVTVAPNATQCVFSINDQALVYSDVNFYVWRETAKSTVRVSTKFGLIISVGNILEEDLFSGAPERTLEWNLGVLAASYVNTLESYASGVAKPVNIRITQLYG
jgi:hypothetical protein